MSNQRGKGQSNRLSQQHLTSGGVLGIFGLDAKKHDLKTQEASEIILSYLKDKYKNLEFRHRKTITKSEIHNKLNFIDNRLGNNLFVKSASIKPDGGIIEVLDKNNTWRVILISEAKHQGNDIENIKNGYRTEVMMKKGQYIMPAGNAIERVHKNIQEMKNFMIDENHFPYVVLLKGSNFITEEIVAKWTDKTEVKISPDNSSLNRIDRVTAANYGMEINKIYCENIEIKTKENKEISLQITSIFSQLKSYTNEQVFNINLSMAEKSLEIISKDLF